MGERFSSGLDRRGVVRLRGESSVVMGRQWGIIRRRFFGIPADAVSFERRGFPGRNALARQRLEHAAGQFVDGYHLALECGEWRQAAERLAAVEKETSGFAFEGAAMALALLDVLTPWRRTRVADFLAGAGSSHVYMVHVGVGWALARLRRNVTRWIARFDPLLRWLIVDGCGFHETFFDWRRYVERQETPRRLTGYARRMFDVGLGRCLWFVMGAEVDRIAAAVAAFAEQRRPDLWSGVGLASVYAGGAEREELETLRRSAGVYLAQAAQGAAFAAKARQRADNIVAHTVMATGVWCGMSVDDAAAATDEALEGLRFDGAEPAFEEWRRRVQARMRNGE